jgi:hypothetical protein
VIKTLEGKIVIKERYVPVESELTQSHEIPPAYEGMTYAELEDNSLVLVSELVQCNADKVSISLLQGTPR